MYITTCKINDRASSMQEAGHPKLVIWHNLEGWDGEGFGRGFRMGGHKPTHG